MSKCRPKEKEVMQAEVQEKESYHPALTEVQHLMPFVMALLWEDSHQQRVMWMELPDDITSMLVDFARSKTITTIEKEPIFKESHPTVSDVIGVILHQHNCDYTMRSQFESSDDPVWKVRFDYYNRKLEAREFYLEQKAISKSG